MLALICGTGYLPFAVATAQTTPPLVCALDGFAPANLAADITFRLEHLGTLLQDLRARGVTDICLCGAIRRPQIDPARIDAATAPLIPVLRAAMARGDDGALRAVIGVFEDAGFAIRGIEDLAPGILPAAGTPTQAKPRRETRADVDIAQRALATMGAEDEGQACIVRLGVVEATETRAGTDAMLRDHATRNLRQGILFKAPKPGQDRRADLPTIGPQTARNAVAAGLDGIVIEAGGVIVIDRPVIIRILDAAGLFLWVRAP